MDPICKAQGCYMFAKGTEQRKRCTKSCRLLPRDPVGLGSIAVHKGEPPQGNPYRGQGRVPGEPVTCVYRGERSRVLGLWLRGKAVEGYSFWYAPTYGGAKRYETPPNVHPGTLDYYWDEEGKPRTSRARRKRA